jgi:hypothetical protein
VNSKRAETRTASQAEGRGRLRVAATYLEVAEIISLSARRCLAQWLAVIAGWW